MHSRQRGPVRGRGNDQRENQGRAALRSTAASAGLLESCPVPARPVLEPQLWRPMGAEANVVHTGVLRSQAAVMPGAPASFQPLSQRTARLPSAGTPGAPAQARLSPTVLSSTQQREVVPQTSRVESPYKHKIYTGSALLTVPHKQKEASTPFPRREGICFKTRGTSAKGCPSCRPGALGLWSLPGGSCHTGQLLCRALSWPGQRTGLALSVV